MLGPVVGQVWKKVNRLEKACEIPEGTPRVIAPSRVLNSPIPLTSMDWCVGDLEETGPPAPPQNMNTDGGQPGPLHRTRENERVPWVPPTGWRQSPDSRKREDGRCGPWSLFEFHRPPSIR